MRNGNGERGLEKRVGNMSLESLVFISFRTGPVRLTDTRTVVIKIFKRVVQVLGHTMT